MTGQLSRLWDAIDFSRRKLAPFRENRFEAIQQYAGSHYGDANQIPSVAINLIAMATDIYLFMLAAHAPRAMVTTPFAEIKPQAASLKLAMDYLVEKINLESTLRLAVFDALFQMGIVKISMRQRGWLTIGGDEYPAFLPYAAHVDLDDWVHDCGARTWEEAEFMGNRYRLSMDELQDSEIYDPKVVAKLRPTGVGRANGQSDHKMETLSTGGSYNQSEYRDTVELWDIYLPHEGKSGAVLTLSPDLRDEPLRVIPWDGPEGGPFVILGFRDLPNNLMPVAPVATWMDLHTLANNLFRKLANQARRQKTVLPVPSNGAEDAKRVIEHGDGDVFKCDTPGNIRELSLGGPSQENLAFLISLRDQFNQVAGNLDLLGGLSPVSNTATQDNMLNENASRRAQDMQATTRSFAKRVMQQLAHYLWYDPEIRLPLVKKIGGVDVPVDWGPEQREGDFLRYNLSIEPYSMQEKTPAGQLNKIMQVWQQLILPVAPIAEQQGIIPNIEGLLRLIAQYADMPELTDMVTFVGPPTAMRPEPVNPQPFARPGQAPVTTRNYVRKSVPQATRQGHDQTLMTLLMGGRAQPANMAALNRGTGG